MSEPQGVNNRMPNRSPRTLAAVLACATLSLTAPVFAAEPEWDPSMVQPCDRACLIGIMDRYLDALKTKNRSNLPLAEDIRMTENTGMMDVGEGLLWRSTVAETTFKFYAADPVQGQVAVGARLMVGNQNTLAAIRLKVERRRILEVEHLWARGIDEAAIPLLTTPVDFLTADVPASERTSRDGLIRAANSYFDAMEGDNGKIGAFAKECVRHENGYQTVNNPPPGGRAMPGPGLPNPDTEQGRAQLELSMMTCEEQINTKTFTFMKRIRPRRVLVVDEQKGVVATFPLFILDGTRRGAPPDAPPGLLQNLAVMESFGIRDGRIYHVEAFPFVNIPYGLGNGWTPGSGR